MDFFFIFSKLIPAFLYPLPFLYIILFTVSFFIKTLWVRIGLWIILPVFWILSTAVFTGWLTEIWESKRKSIAELEVYDCGIVLGGLSSPALSNSDHLEFGFSSERILAALKLYKMGKIKNILISGGSGDLFNQDLKEADQLGKFLLENGVLSNHILIERDSKNTYENAKFSIPILEKSGFKKTLLITSAYHMVRSEAIFKKFKLDITTWPVDTLATSGLSPFSFIADPADLNRFQILLKEWLGYIAYSVAGYL